MKIIKTFRFICVIVLLMTGIGVSAYDFTVDGIYYDVESLPDLTCRVVRGDKEYGGYEGDIFIPNKVTYNNRTIIAKTKCAKSENETSKTSLFSLTFSLLIFGLCNSFQCLKDWKELEF